MKTWHYMTSRVLYLVPMLILSHCSSVGPLTYRLSHNPPQTLVAVQHERGMKIETWHISGKPYSKVYIKDGKKIKKEIFTEDGRLYAEDVILPNGMTISKIFDEQGRLKSLSKDMPGNPAWHYSEVYNPDGSVKIRGKWFPSLSPSQIKASGIYEQIERGFDRIPAGGVLPKAIEPQR